MNTQRVLKFGGAALADGPSVLAACRIMAARAAERPVVVVSAHSGVTDLLQEVACAAAAGRLEADRVRIRHRSLLSQLGLDPELLDRYWRELLHIFGQIRDSRELSPAHLDHVLSYGERMSARVVAASLQSLGVVATPVDAWDLGFVTDSNHGRARPLEGIGASIRAALAEVQGIAIVTGFLAKDQRGSLTTLGRNGSDLTAAILAEAINAAEIEYWKSVGGILTADPELVPDARRLDRISYAEATELAFHGARVLHPASIEPTRRAKIGVRVFDVNDPHGPGTRFEVRSRRAGPVAIGAKRGVLKVELPVRAPELRGERVNELFGALERAGAAPGLLLSSGQRIGALIDPGAAADDALRALGGEAVVSDRLATLAVVGGGVGQDAALGQRCLQLLDQAGVRVVHAVLGARDLSQAFAVAKGDLPLAVRTLHDALLGAPKLSC